MIEAKNSELKHQHVHLIASHEANMLFRLKKNIQSIMDLLFSFICLKLIENKIGYIKYKVLYMKMKLNNVSYHAKY